MGYFVKNRQLQSGSSGVVLPTGTTAQRPTAPQFGLIRYNTELGYIEYFNGSVFQAVGVAGAVTYNVQSFTGDGATVTFGLGTSVVESQLIVFVGSIFQAPDTYAITGGGVDITFDQAPPPDVPINVVITDS